uniref:MAGUK p55 subfamily member 5 n=1 Tax=Parascaris univalens TaxID=6257 RepID=A0A915C7P9_PARUN
MAKFRATKPPTQYPMNGSVDLWDEASEYDSRSNTLTMYTFRPYEGISGNAYGVTASSVVNAPRDTSPNSPTPYTTTTVGYESDAYRPGAAIYQNVFYSAENSSAVPSTFKEMKSPVLEGTCDAFLSPQDALSHMNDDGNMRFNFARNTSRCHQLKKHLHTYEDEEITMRLSNSSERVGFSMAGGADENLETFVNSILAGTPADRAGLCVGDEIVEVNGTPVEGKEHAEVVRLIHKCIKSRIIQLRVRRKQDVNDDEFPQTNPEVKISDAYLVSVDRDHIKEVGKKLKRNYPGIKTYDMETVAATPPGRIPEPLSVQNANISARATQLQISNGELEDAGSGSNSLQLGDQVARMKKYGEDLRKRKELDERREREQDFLRASLRGSKKLQSLETGSLKKIEFAYDKTANEKIIEMGYSNRCYVASDVSYRESLGKCDSEAIPLEQVIVSVNRVANHLEHSEGRKEESRIIRDFFTREPIQKAIEAAAVHHSTQKPTTSSDASTSGELGVAEIQGGLKIVKLTKCDDTYLGATVRNEGEKVIVGRVVKGGVAERSNLLHEGDELIEANGHDLRGKSVTEVCDILRSISGELSLVVVPSSKAEIDGGSGESNTTIVQHVRALFDYDPEDDVYVPCKELALKFQRGDILHVISTSDENWWQAYREGDDPSCSLAGLIPSVTFQQQLIIYNRELERENISDCGKRKDFFGCAKKKAFIKAKGKRASEDMKPADEVASDEEMLTYEKVSLYLSKTSRKRPIVLCGPEGVGCLELRQRLVECDKDKFSCAVPHTTRPKKAGEVDGVHFHFATRQKFQEDAKMGRFIEYGEYQKYLYGTSIASIQAVVDRAKICLLTLKAENLKALRRTSLMPYVVFIAPPALQQLRRQKELLGQHGIKDDQLKLILNEGKLTEQKYGHLFDRIIVNADLDRSLNELKDVVRKLEVEPQWVPSFWLNGNSANASA